MLNFREFKEAVKILGKRRVFALITALLVLSSSASATAAPVSVRSKKAEARRIQADVDRIDDQLEVVVEKYNQAKLKLGRTRLNIKAANTKLASAEKALYKSRTALNRRMAILYRDGATSSFEVLLGAKTFNEFFLRFDLLTRIADSDAKLIRQIQAAKSVIEQQKAALAKQEKIQTATASRLKAEKKKISAKLKERSRLLASIKNEIAELQRSEAKRQSLLQQRYRRALASRRLGRSRSVSVSRGGSRSNVVGVAMDQLGKPYRWGADGPESFDCSGLTQYVYAKVGVSLSHSSRAQYNEGQRVSRDALEAGDLVFFARGGEISHVGLYIGGGNFIEAPRTGLSVRISSLSGRGGYVGAVRP